MTTNESQESGEVVSRVQHLRCTVCNDNITAAYEQATCTPILVCHCTHVGGRIDPQPMGKIHAGNFPDGWELQEPVATDGGVPRTDRLELSDRQRDRLDQIKQQCTEDGRLPEPTDSEMLDSLLDTWDAVDEGHYADVDGPTIRVLRASDRRGAASDRGWQTAVEYIVEGESGKEMMWLDGFLDEHCPGVEVADPGAEVNDA